MAGNQAFCGILYLLLVAYVGSNGMVFYFTDCWASLWNIHCDGRVLLQPNDEMQPSWRSNSSTSGYDRICSIFNARKAHGGELPSDLHLAIETDKDHTISCHRACVSSYTSKEKIGVPEVNSNSSSQQPPMRTRLSETFSFQAHCIFCGEICKEFKDS